MKKGGRLRTDSGQHRRILAVMAVLGVLGFVPGVLRLGWLMLGQYDRYAELALDNQTRITPAAGDRGRIYDRNMNILASSVTVEQLYLDPQELKQSRADIEKISAFLGDLLEKDPEWIAKQASDLRLRYKRIASGLDGDTAGKIRDFIRREKISGIHLEPDSKRVYPMGTLAAQTLGFANSSGEGCEGIEAAYDSFLRAKPGQVITTKGSNEMDMPFSYEHYRASHPGADVILTLDATVQSCLEHRLREAMDRYDVKNGAFGLVMNCKTGEILAMATLPDYDPNRYQEILDLPTLERLNALEGEEKSKALTEARLRQWRNRVISDGYEPGSTFKVLTMAAALDCGAIDLNTDFYCRGAEQIPGRSQLLHCWRHQGHGAEKTPQALQNSCNIAFAHIALKLGGERFYDYIQKFGILEKTGIDLNGESKGVFFDKALVTDTDKWGTASLTSGSFGQTFKLTPMQLVRAIASVVNGGMLPEPYLVSEVLDSQGHTLLRQTPAFTRRTVSEETSAAMRTLIRSVVTEGTARNAAVAGFSIGGKTGTSEKIDVFDENGRRVLDKIVSFVGIAPMDDPEYIVLAALDTPSRDTGIYISGGVMAAPTVGAILGDILPYLGVPRVYGEEDLQSQEIFLEDFTGFDPKEAEKILKEQTLGVCIIGTGDRVTGQLPPSGETVPGGSQVILYLGEPVPPETGSRQGTPSS